MASRSRLLEMGLAVYAGQTWRTRARWTSDVGWHLVAMGGLASAIGRWIGLPPHRVRELVPVGAAGALRRSFC